MTSLASPRPSVPQEGASIDERPSHEGAALVELSADAFASALAEAFARLTTFQVLSACAVACARIERQ